MASTSPVGAQTTRSDRIGDEKEQVHTRLKQLEDFGFLERAPGVGPGGPPVRHVELPYISRSNGV